MTTQLRELQAAALAAGKGAHDVRDLLVDRRPVALPLGVRRDGQARRRGGQVAARQIGIGAEYTLANGVGLQGFYRVNDYDNWGKENILALGASYDLGGGATIKGGVVYAKDKPDVGPDESRTIADFGIKFAF